MTIIQFLREFPAIFAVVGLLVGGAIMFWVSRKFGPIQNAAWEKVVEAKQQQIDAQIELAKITAAQYETSLKMQAEHWTEELNKMEASRDQYKTDLHAVRGELGTENTNLKLRVQELELRPSLEIVQTEQQNFYRDMSDTLKGIATALKQHDDKIDERMEAYFGPLQSACAGTAEAMTALVKTLTKKKAQRTA